MTYIFEEMGVDPNRTWAASLNIKDILKYCDVEGGNSDCIKILKIEGKFNSYGSALFSEVYVTNAKILQVLK